MVGNDQLHRLRNEAGRWWRLDGPFALIRRGGCAVQRFELKVVTNRSTFNDLNLFI